jgi:RimJ/RimL family protein N-acetyltransferase
MHLSIKNLHIRAYEQTDAPQLFAAIQASMPELSKWMDWAQSPPTLEKVHETIAMFEEQIASGKEHPLAIFLQDGTFVGSSGYRVINKAVPSFEIGYWLDTRYTGKGIMTEAVVAQTEFLFEDLKAQRVDIQCHADNTPSMKVALNAGFKMEATLRNHRRHVDGTLADTKILTHTPETWQAFYKLY